MYKYTDILWDFNGTILDDVETGIKSVNKLLSDRGLKQIGSVDEYHRVFCFPVKKYYENVGFDLESESFEEIAPQWVEQYMLNVRGAKIFDDVRETIVHFSALGVKQTVLSATELDMLRGQLRDLGLDGLFDDVLGLDNIHAESKIEIAKRWRDAHKTAKALLIGDSVHDFETSKAIDAKCVLVARGHQSKDTLEKCGVPVVDTLGEIFKYNY